MEAKAREREREIDLLALECKKNSWGAEERVLV